MRQIHQAQERGFARAARSDQEVKRARRQREADIVENFRSDAIAHADILKTDHG
jgi:hypothetical protein